MKPIPFKNRKSVQGEAPPKKEKRGVSRDTLIMLVAVVIVTMAVFAVYRFLLTCYYFEVVLIVYMVLATAAVLGYVIYNRGFSRRSVTTDMLPDSWSAEEKEAFLADGKRRMKSSRWLLVIVFAFLFTFAFDIFELIVIPFIKGLIGL